MEAQTHPTLLAERRTESGKGSARRLRRAGLLPAACYGRDMDALTLAINLDALEDALDSPRGLNTVFNVQVEGEDIQFNNVILHDYQVEPVSRALLHVDLLVVDQDQLIEVSVPIQSVGRARGERAGGKLRMMLPDIKVRCAASNIPIVIDVDVSDLGPNDVTMASQLVLPEGVIPAFTGDFAIARVMMPRQNVIGLDTDGDTGADIGEEAEGEAGEEGGGE